MKLRDVKHKKRKTTKVAVPAVGMWAIYPNPLKISNMLIKWVDSNTNKQKIVEK